MRTPTVRRKRRKRKRKVNIGIMLYCVIYIKHLTISTTHPVGKKGRTVKQSSSDQETSSSSEEIKDDPEALKRRVDDVLASITEGATRKGLTSEEAAVRLLPFPVFF